MDMPASQPAGLDTLVHPESSSNDYWRRVLGDSGGRQIVVVGHRGSGKNKSRRFPWAGSIDPPPSIRENTLLSFVTAAQQGADFLEFDVQVTRDGHPVIFHDDLIVTGDRQARGIGELTLEEFKCLGPQKGGSWGMIPVSSPASGRELLRECPDGQLEAWECDIEDSLCTLAEAMEGVPVQIGFDIEIKLRDDETSIDEVCRVVNTTLAHVLVNAKGRNVVFSTFHPEAAILLRRTQSLYPVLFLTVGGMHQFDDPRRNSMEEAIKLCLDNSLSGIVSEVTPLLQQPEYIKQIKAAKLQLLTYGERNNLLDAVYFQQCHGVDAVIVDHVRPISTAARSVIAMPAMPEVSGLLNDAPKNPVALPVA